MMGDNHSFLALDWVKGEIEETLKQSRQALEAFVENPEDGAQMRFCLAYLHQVFGTLQMVEFYGAALLAEEMEKLCLALINGQVSRIPDGQEVLMRAILQLPPYLERVKASRRDLPVVLLPLLNDLRAARGEPLLSETALFTPDLAAGERAPIQVSSADIAPVLLKKIRQAYQLALLGVIRNDNTPDNLKKMAHLFARLETLAGASPLRELWLVSAALVEGLIEKSIDAGTSVKMLLAQVDRQLRNAGGDASRRAPTDLLKNLLYYVAKSSGNTGKLRSVKDLYRLDDALPGDALVNEERARMNGPDREAMKSVVDALCEELARVKDALDLFVRKTDAEKSVGDLSALVPVLKQVADTVAVLGLGQPRRILQEQIETIDSITSSGVLPLDGRLLDIAGAVLYVEATLMGMVAEKPIGQTAANPASEFSAQDQLSDAQSAVLRESRGALEKAKDAIIEYIASQWNPTHLESIPELVDTVRGGLSILSLHRPAEILGAAGRYVSQSLLAGQHRPDWKEMDTLADVITSIEYYLERIANDTHGGDNILDIAERGLAKLGFAPVDSAAPPLVNAVTDDESDDLASGDEGEWTAENAAAFEAEIADATALPEEEIIVETREDEVLQDRTADTLLREISDELNVAQSSFAAAPFADAGIEEAPAAAAISDEEWLANETADLGESALNDFMQEGDSVSASLEPAAGDEFFLEDIESVEGDAVTAVLPVVESEGSFFIDESAANFDESALIDAIEVEGASLDVASEPMAETPAPVVEAAKKPVLPVLTRMPEDNHDFDEEIREIFVEEAEEVMENINQYFPKWAANFEDTASLLEFRRGFHTLKGSGRMVGARVVAELAWAFENMLNKVRDKILQPDQVMVNLVSECLSVIPGLVEDFAHRQPPRLDTSPLMEAADAVSRGEVLSALDVARAAEQAHAFLEADTSSAEDFDALAASLEAPVDSAPATTVTVNAIADESDPLLELSADVITEDTGAAAVADEGVEATPRESMSETDPVLLEIFTSEAETHLEEIRHYLDAVDPERSATPISDEVLRSLHTLKGSAGMAGINAVADIASPMEHLFKDLRNQTGNARRDHLHVLRDGHDLINASISNLVSGGDGHIEAADELIARINRLDQERLASLEKERSEQLMNSEVASDLTAATKGLVASFMELGLDHVLDAPWELDGWLSSPDASARVDALQHELSLLANAADNCSVAPLALLSSRLAGVYARLAALELSLDSELLNDLAGAHDEIINTFDTLAASQTVYANEAVLTRLLDLLETPVAALDVALNDEPSMAAFVSEAQPSLAEQMTDADSAAWEEPADLVAVDAVDPELLEIFLEEADEVLEAAQGELDAWRNDHDNKAALGALQRHLHTLKGGARLAEIRPLGDLSHELEFLYEGLVDGRYKAAPELTNLLQRCHDRLADMVGELRSSGNCVAGFDLVTAINAYRRDPAAGVPDVDAGATEPGNILPVDEVHLSSSETDQVESSFSDEFSSLPEEAVADSVAEVAVEDRDAVFAEFFPGLTQPVVDEVEPAAVIEPAPLIEPAVVIVSAPAVSVAPEDQGFDPELLEIFLEEAGEIVDATSEQLAAWHNDINNTLPVQQLQRGLHTLKGGARMAEIVPLGDLAHHLENLYEAVCDGLMTPTPMLFTLLHRCHDRLAESVDALRHQGACPETSDLVLQITSYAADPENFQDTPASVTLTPVEPEIALVADAQEAHAVAPPPGPKTIEAAPVPENVDSDILEIFLEESEELAEGIETTLQEWLGDRDSTIHMEALLRHLHTLKGGARLAGLKKLGDLAHDWETDLAAVQSGAGIVDDAFFAGLAERQQAVLESIKAVRGGFGVASPAVAESVADEPLVVAEPMALVSAPAVSLTAPVVAGVVASGERIMPPSMQGGFRKDAGARGPQEMIRVPSDLLEKLVNLAGETSITRSRVEMGVHGFAQTVEEMGSTIQRLAEQLRRMDAEMESQIISRHNEDTGGKYEDFDPLEMDQYSSLNQLSKALTESASDLLDLKSTLIDKARDTETLLLQQSRINTELQEGLMRSRMVPFSRLVPRLKRIVRQTGQEVHKPADLDVINPEGEMDRTLLERIVAPLEHMLRNAVDHGLEDQAGRAAAGKPAQGRVTLTLAREGGEVVLTLSDDGRGINIPAVRKKALERGLITADQDISDQDVIQFIFHAGFSTAAAVTQISGRGVGMDVVTSEIKQMGGVVSIHSVSGQGTTFTVRLPFTVAVNRALMVRIGEDSYAIPLSQIEGIVRASPYELETYYAPDAPLFEYANVAYRLSYLGEFVHGVKSPNLLGHTLPLPVLLIRGGEQRIAIQVDQLIGSREIVVKSVGAQLASVAGISGATILGDGSVVIILDVIAMLRAASQTQPRIAATFDAGTGKSAAETARTRLVMVVDDSVTVRKVTSRLLERHGYEVLLAKDGMDAIAKLEDQRPDVMLLDIEMPRMDGFEVASLVRHNPNLEDLPIIMITSRTGEKHRERAFQIGVNAYMGKPFQEDQLLETIAELLAASTVR
ncbi:MAG: Hpt domain-containing protein [bacterium]|nr:Hpt domain-containing protein [bacterium]